MLFACVSTLALLPAQVLAGEDAAGEAPAVSAIRFYQEQISSLRHQRCPFTPSCSEYAAQAIERYGLAEGSARAADRLMRCNASVASNYPSGPNGTRLDPVDGVPGPEALRVPPWLLPSPEPHRPPVAEALDAGRLARIEETCVFADELAARGDPARAATEFQRAASLAAAPGALAWAFARTGECELAARRWPEAGGAYLTAGMLASEPRGRARAAFGLAASRFGGGAFAATDGVLGASDLAAGDDPGPARTGGLRGLAAMGLGDWPRATHELATAAGVAEPALASRLRLLAAYAEEGPKLPTRSVTLARTFSAIVPGTGQMYAGRTRDGFRHLIFNAALIATVVSFVRHEEYPAAYIAGAFALPFYVGNILGAGAEARRHDRREREALLMRALKEAGR